MGMYNYKSKCKHCGAKPFSEGPHHEQKCPRYQQSRAFNSKLAMKKQCRYCEAKPFVAGPHHSNDCKRYEPNMNV